jgi:hypothetical protein
VTNDVLKDQLRSFQLIYLLLLDGDIISKFHYLCVNSEVEVEFSFILVCQQYSFCLSSCYLCYILVLSHMFEIK